MRFVAAGVIVAALSASGTAAGQAAKQARPRAAAPGARAAAIVASGITPGELEKWFDSWVLLQAQDSLKLSDAQFPRFLQRLRALQDVRRRHQQSRRQLVVALTQLVKAQPFDEAQAKERLKALTDLDLRGAEEVRKAAESLNEVMDTLQQARFRLLEDTVERKKIDLLLRARRAAQPADAER
jgi:hypothetical protein